MEKNINYTKKKKACCSCGICAGVCPRHAISMKIDSKTGILLPYIHKEHCVECGKCLKICPGLANANIALSDTPDNHRKRQCDHFEAYVGNITDHELLKNCTSGGIVSELIRTLLDNSVYDSAFLVNDNQYSDIVESKRAEKYIQNSSKSRYVAISHAQSARYLLEHREERIIIIAVSCALSGFKKLIEEYHLDQDNYLLIGLFCDKVLTYKIWSFFSHKYAAEGCLTGLDFRNKEDSGWPGDMQLYFDNKHLRIDRKERMQIKSFFQHERCLYCADKLNESADISIGDNYTNVDASEDGSSSIIVRTPAGAKALNQIKDKCLLSPISINRLYESQRMEKKQKNLSYANLKYQGIFHSKISCKELFHYGKAILMIKIGCFYSRAPQLTKIVIRLFSMFSR